MEFTKLSYFKVLAETQNMVVASEKLYITQPALSKAIKKLEEELGVSLFDRVNGKMLLNDAGKLLLSYANLILGIMDDFENDLKRINEKNILRISTANKTVLSLIMPIFARNFPDITLYPKYQNGYEKIYLLEKINDISIVPEPIEDDRIENVLLFEDSAVVSVPITNELANRDSIYLKDLDKKIFVAFNSGDLLSSLVYKVAEENNISLHNVYQTDMHSCFKLARESNYFVFGSNLGSHFIELGDERRYIPLDKSENLSLMFYASYLKENKSKVQVFVNFIKKMVEDVNNNNSASYKL